MLPHFGNPRLFTTCAGVRGLLLAGGLEPELRGRAHGATDQGSDSIALFEKGAYLVSCNSDSSAQSFVFNKSDDEFLSYIRT